MFGTIHWLSKLRPSPVRRGIWGRGEGYLTQLHYNSFIFQKVKMENIEQSEGKFFVKPPILGNSAKVLISWAISELRVGTKTHTVCVFVCLLALVKHL